MRASPFGGSLFVFHAHLLQHVNVALERTTVRYGSLFSRKHSVFLLERERVLVLLVLCEGLLV